MKKSFHNLLLLLQIVVGCKLAESLLIKSWLLLSIYRLARHNERASDCGRNYLCIYQTASSRVWTSSITLIIAAGDTTVSCHQIKNVELILFQSWTKIKVNKNSSGLEVSNWIPFENMSQTKLFRQQARSHGLEVKIDVSRPRGRGIKPQNCILNGRKQL